MMNVLLFGATGMVGQGVLRECLLADDVARVVTIGRRASGVSHPKLHEIVQSDLLDYRAFEAELRDIDACFFCLGMSSVGKAEADYTRVTFDITLAAARALVGANPRSTFVYVSGAGADSTGGGPTMWARVRGRTENALLATPFANVAILRPAVIQPLHGARSKTLLYRLLYAAFVPVFPLLRLLAPHLVSSTEAIGQAMLEIARHGTPKPILDTAGINDVATRITKAGMRAA
jgi:uncharacterized protein YbjT (DUF2867 family)